MEVVFTEQFEQAYSTLTRQEKQGVMKAVAFLGENPRHPGLNVKKMEGKRNIWEARVSRRLRMTFEISGETITMRNVGEHDSVLKTP